MSVTTAQVTAALEGLTKKGLEFMTQVGKRQFSFFDDGIVEGSGSWGNCLSEEGFTSVRSAAGVMGATKKLGLWATSSGGDDDDSLWWSLTELGAAVANLLGADEEPVAPSMTAKVGAKWTYLYAADGSLIAELRNDQLAAIAAFLA